MLKDLLASLKQGTEQIESRMAANSEALGSYTASQIMSSSAAPTGGPGAKRGGRVGDMSMPAGKLGSFLKAVAAQESGGNYGAVGVPTKYGTAYGKYQILDSNINGPGGWDKEVLGKNVSVQKFLNTPRLQEKIARGKLTQYYNRYGPEGAAKSWYAGEGNARTNSDSSQYGGPSINDYAAQVLEKMRGR